MTELSDESIAVAVQKGDKDAFAELVFRYEEKLRRYARKFLNTGHEIDDLVQDVFIKAYTNIKSFDAGQRFSPWVYRIAHNTFVNELKRKGRYGHGFLDADTILPLMPAKETADRDALFDEVSSEIESLLTGLSAKYREVVILHYFESLSYQEISDVLKIPVTTVGVRMSRARKKMKEAYDQHNALS